MKRNMVPLLGIAFVVAIISTGVFYGLFAGKLHSSDGDSAGQPVIVAAREMERGAVLQASDVRTLNLKGTLSGSFSKPGQVVGATLLAEVKRNEPLLESRLLTKDPEPGHPSETVPSGMRAISIRAWESEGLSGLLRPGSRVDLQSVVDKNGSIGLRTVLENVQVLALNPPAPQGAFTLTVLIPAEVAETVALADAGSHIRVALRNTLDSAVTSHRSTAVVPARPGAGAEAASKQNSQAAGPSVQVRLQVLSASETALADLNAKLASGESHQALRVDSFPDAGEAAALIQRLAQRREIEVVAAKTFATDSGEATSFRAGARSCQLRVRWSPEGGSHGQLKLKVEPELQRKSGSGVETTAYRADLPGAGSFLILGILDGPHDRAAREALFPGHTWENRALVIFVAAEPSHRKPSSTVAQANRGR